jgi:hypothetical protein
LRRKTPQTGLFAPIFWLTPKGFPLQSLARPGGQDIKQALTRAFAWACKKPGQEIARRSRVLAKRGKTARRIQKPLPLYPGSRLQAVKTRPEKLRSNFASVFTQNGRSRPFNPLRPTGFKKWFHFGTGSIYLG